MINKQILITSLNKEIEKSKIYGKLDLSILYFFNLVMYYIDYTEGVEVLNEYNKCLKDFAYRLKYCYPNIICNYKIIDSSLQTIENTPPTISDKNIDLNGNFIYQIKAQDFLTDYQDAQNHTYKKVILYPSSLTQGQLKFNNNVINSPLEINLNNNFDLKYVFLNSQSIKNTEEVNTFLNFKVSDIFDAFSVTQSLNFTNSEFTVNSPATIGDISLSKDNRVETVFTMDLFTTFMSPPYSDPENDQIDAIRIDSISSSNQGQFLINNIPIQVGDIITREEINAGDFKHVGPDTDALTTDLITFSGRDEGSLIWVQ